MFSFNVRWDLVAVVTGLLAMVVVGLALAGSVDMSRPLAETGVWGVVVAFGGLALAWLGGFTLFLAASEGLGGQ